MTNQIKITFFCELEPDALVEVFNKDTTLNTLKDLGAGISLGILDLSYLRASVVKKLNQANIPVTAWLLLPKQLGYWFNLDNVKNAEEQYHQFLIWANEFQLQFHRIGLDIEPDINLINQLGQNKGKRLLVKKLVSRYKHSEAEERYKKLIDCIRNDGFIIEAYQIPFTFDEAQAGSNVLKKVFGIISLPVDIQIPMLYSSMLKSKKPGLLLSYANEATGLAIGSTGGGVKIQGQGELAHLSPDEFVRDVSIALKYSNNIHIFSLEGCITNGYFEKRFFQPKEYDKNKFKKEKLQIDILRCILRVMLWSGANLHWIVVIACILIVIFLF